MAERAFVVRGRVAQSPAETQIARHLHRPLPQGRLAHKRCALVVFERRGKHLGGRRRVAVHEHDEGLVGCKASGGHLRRLVHLARLDLHHGAALHEQAGHVDGLREVAAGVVADVEHERRGPLLLEVLHGGPYEVVGVLRDLLELDVAHRPLERMLHVLHRRVRDRKRRGVLLAALVVKRRGPPPRDDHALPLVAPKRRRHLGGGPVVVSVAVDGHHEIALEHAGRLRSRAFEHVYRVSAPVVLREQHPHARVPARAVLHKRRVTRRVVIAQVRILRGVGQRTQNVRRGHGQIVGIEAVLLDDALHLRDARSERVVSVARRGRADSAIGIHHERREAERFEQRRLAAHEEADSESGAHRDDDGERLGKSDVARTRPAFGRREFRRVGVLGHGRKRKPTPSSSAAWPKRSRASR